MFLTQNVEIFMKCKLYLSSGVVESNLIGAIISDQINQLLTSARHQQPSITTFQHSQATVFLLLGGNKSQFSAARRVAWSSVDIS